MTQQRPALSLIVPTRQRTDQLSRLLDSLAATTSRPGDVEVVLVIDADDQPTLERLVDLGVDGIFTDRPDTLRTVLEQRGLWS